MTAAFNGVEGDGRLTPEYCEGCNKVHPGGIRNCWQQAIRGLENARREYEKRRGSERVRLARLLRVHSAAENAAEMDAETTPSNRTPPKKRLRPRAHEQVPKPNDPSQGGRAQPQ